MNKVILIGRLTRDPELRFTASGKAVASFGIAVNRSFSRENEADFFNVVVWGKTAENCANYLAKGRLIAVDGRLQSGSYETKTGEKRNTVEVVANTVKFLEWGDRENKTPKREDNDFGSIDIDINEFQAMEDDDDIPF